MKFGIDWRQRSTIRGAVWVLAGIVGLAMVLEGRDIQSLIALAMSVAGGLGVAVKD